MKLNSDGTYSHSKEDVLAGKVPRYTLYRYSDQKYIDDFFSDDSLRISPLSYYNVEGLGKEIGDDQEGFSRWHHYQTTPYKGVGPIPRPLDRAFNLTGFSGGQIDISGNMIITKEVSRPCYILSTSEVLSGELAVAFGASGAFAIDSPIQFAAKIREAIFEQHDIQVEGTGVLNCKYILSREGACNPRLEEPELLKLTSYEHQREVRMIWYTEKADAPIFVKVPEAVRFCRQVSV